MRNTFSPRKFSKNCICCPPSLNARHFIFPSGIPSRSDIFPASPSFPPRLKSLYSMRKDYITANLGPKYTAHLARSGRRESNSGYKTPSLAYYHYTTARLFGDVLGRAAGNRTRALRTRSVCTTGILRPDQKHHTRTYV